MLHILQQKKNRTHEKERQEADDLIPRHTS